MDLFVMRDNKSEFNPGAAYHRLRRRGFTHEQAACWACALYAGYLLLHHQLGRRARRLFRRRWARRCHRRGRCAVLAWWSGSEAAGWRLRLLVLPPPGRVITGQGWGLINHMMGPRHDAAVARHEADDCLGAAGDWIRLLADVAAVATEHTVAAP